MTIPTLLWRAWRLRCAICGEGRLFRGWFAMNEKCSHCGASFVREPGFFLGSIYFNYSLTVIIVTAAYVTLNFGYDVSPEILLPAFAVFTVAFPLWYFRRARSLWLAFDQYFDPRRGEGASGAKGVEEKGRKGEGANRRRGDTSEPTELRP